MASWTDQVSYPIVTLKRLKGPEKDLILAKQESFLEHSLPKHDVIDGKNAKNTTADQEKFSSRYLFTASYDDNTKHYDSSTTYFECITSKKK